MSYTTYFKKNLMYLFFGIFLILLYYFLYKIYIPRVNAFGCFDDCYNIVAGYLISKGNTLYADIPFNHQMLMAYLSSFIQIFLKPINIYELVLRHRQLLMLFSFFMNFLILIRYKYPGIIFVVFYEISKFYLFGDRFLAEGFIVYPLVYMTGTAWFKLRGKKIYLIDYVLAGIFSWFVIFMREPYTLSAVFLYILVIWGKKDKKAKFISVALVTVLSLIILVNLDLKAYYYNIFTINARGILKKEVANNELFGIGLLKVFLYPIYIFITGYWNLFRVTLIGINTVFFISIILFIKKVNKFIPVLIVLFILGLTNLRVGTPGRVYYEAFHFIPWFGMFLFITFILLFELSKLSKKIFTACILFLVLVLLNFINSPDSYLKDKPDPHFDLLTNYGHYMTAGNIIRILSTGKHTLFVDGYDELIMWQADRKPAYKYLWYTSYMPYYQEYADAREEMFLNYPPDFYYGSCPYETIGLRLMPQKILSNYRNLSAYGLPSCLFIRKEIIKSIPQAAWDRVQEYEYELAAEQT